MGFRIFAAAILGDVDAVDTELSAAGDAKAQLLSQRNAKGATIMHVAAMHGHTKLVEWLANNHRRAEYLSGCELHGRTPLHLAALHGKADVVIELLKLRGVDPMCMDANMYTPLLLAASHGHNTVLMELLKGPKDQQLKQLTTAEGHGRTALHLAVRHGHVHTVRFLAKKFTAKEAIDELTRKDHLRWTAVHSAAGTGRLDIVEEIFKMYSDSGILDQQVSNTVWSPLHVAAWLGHAEVLKMMCGKMGFGVKKPSDNLERLTPLHIAAHNGHDALVDDLLMLDPSLVHDFDALQRTALHYASRQGHTAVVSKLLSSWKESTGSSSLLVNESDVNGLTALHLAAREGHKQVVHVLLEAEANVNAKTESSLMSKSLLDVILSSYETIVEPMLLDADCWCISQMTPLHLAAKNGHMGVVRELLQCREVNIGALDGHGLMPLDWAKVRGVEKDFLEQASQLLRETSAARVPKKKVRVLREEMLKWEKTVALRMPPSSFHSFESMQYTTEAYEDLDQMGKCGKQDGNNSDPSAVNLHSTSSKNLHSTPYGGAPDTTTETLLQELYEITGQDSQSGNTPLHVAVKYGNTKAVEAELKHGPSDAVNVKNSDGRTPLELAFEKNHVEICKLILQNSKEVEDHLNDMLEKAIAENWLDMSLLLIGDARTRMGGSIRANLLDEASHSAEKKFLDTLLRRATIKKQLLQERREHLDSAGAILVIAGLIASITYQGILQPPQGKHRWALLLFDWSNAIAFYSAVATTIAVASGSLPIRHMYELIDSRKPMGVSRGISSVLLTLSSACVVWAYAAAGFARFAETLENKPFSFGNGMAAIVTTLFLVLFLKNYIQLYEPFSQSSNSRSNGRNEGHIYHLFRRVAEIVQKIPSMCSRQGNDGLRMPLCRVNSERSRVAL